MRYNFQSVEQKWKEEWKNSELYKISNESDKPKYYVLDMFPYPSGAGLHVGHPLGYIASDIFARYKRLKGFNVLHPMGFDAFGLPAEEYAIATGVHPADSTAVNIARYKEQLDNIGFCFDWSREVQTCDSSYYKWTQWIFSLLFSYYYDLDSEKAEPISNLVEKLDDGQADQINAFTSRKNKLTAEEWQSADEKKKSNILSDYRLAYRKIGYVNWCPALGTVLANDQIKEGLSERGGHPVEKKAMTQWNLRTTAYAERLLSGLDKIDWSNSLKTIQRNWIGKSLGAQIFFPLDGHEEKLEIFTTRADTIFGATYMVLAPEHPLIEKITTASEADSVNEYQTYVKTRSDRDRMADVKEVTGVFTGGYALNPFNNKRIPIWIGEYVLMDYGTGAIMAVPSDDDRDYAFATKFGLEIIDVVDKSEHAAATNADKVGVIINSEFLNGMQVSDAIAHMGKEITERGIGQVMTNYKMRDAGFSRQRYWGEPFPVVYKNDIPYTVDLDKLPVELPHTQDFKPTEDGRSPLSRKEDWKNLDEDKIRETDTMPAVAGSSWYFLRYMDPNNANRFASKEALNYWQDVDLYVGGAEHAVAHLLYARFWHKFLYDLGYVPTNEPFKKLINQGMIQGVIEFLPLMKGEDDENIFVSADILDRYPNIEFAKIPIHINMVKDYGTPESHIDADGVKQFVSWRSGFEDAQFITKDDTLDVKSIPSSPSNFAFQTLSEVGKMSKRYHNVVNPDDVISEYGADTFRLYEMFLGPIEQSKPWDTNGIEGVSKFVKKFWGLFLDGEEISLTDDEPTKEEYKCLHQAIKKVSNDIEKFSFNTAISAMMICVNDLRKLGTRKRKILEPMIVLVAPFAPFLAEELWALSGNSFSVHGQDFPKFDESYLVQDSIDYPICVNGKKRVVKNFNASASKEDMEKVALEDLDIQKWLEGKNVVKVIVVPKRMINIVVK